MQHSALGSRADPYDSSNRRRTPLACEACYKKKIKCDVEGVNTACVQCMRRNITCRFPSRREKRETLKRTHYVKNLEDRLHKMETLLKAAGLIKEDIIAHPDLYGEDENLDGESDDDSEQHEPHPEPSRQNSTDSSPMGQESTGTVDIEDVPNQNPHRPVDSSTPFPQRRRLGPCSNVIQEHPVFRWDNREDSRYYGRSSFLSILSREGIEWIKEKTGEVRFLNLIFSDTNRDTPWDYWRPDVFHDVFSSRVFKALPPRAEVFTLLRQYFRTVNRLFPLYHEETFMRLVEWQYTQQTCDDAARWASINIILSLAYEYRYSNSQKSERDREKAWLYFKNAISVFTELTLRRTDILSVQALLGMALFLRGNSGTQSSLPLITAAIRSCHRMGLHRNIPRSYLPPVEQEQRKRVFWVAYVMDQSVCIRAGNAPTQPPDDFDIDLPAKHAEDEFIMSNNTSFFYQMCHMAVIKSRIYNRLYAAKALLNKSPWDVLEIVRGLHEDLEEWKRESAFNQSLSQRGSGDDFLVGFATAGLQCLYYNSLIMIHRLPLMMHYAYVHRLASGSRMHFDYKKIMGEAAASSAICVQAARDTLRLVNNLPWGDIAWIWSLLYYVFLAVMTIFVSILREPDHPKAKEDLQALSMAATFFATLVPGDDSCNYARFMTRMCANFERVARAVLEKNRKTIKSSDKPASSIAAAAAVQDSAQASHPEQNPPSGVNIPNLEGLPRINSAGYVVPDSLSDTDDDMTGILATPSQTSTSLHPPAHSVPASGDGFPQPAQFHQHPQHGRNDPYTMDSMFPISVTESFSQPELWQIPLTADWEFGGQFLGGLFGQAMPYPQGNLDPSEGPPTTTMPPASMGMGYGFMNSGSAPGGSDPGTHPLWPGGGGFMNSYL
ncbi:fungal-specific transcription factor domain-containing protein [Aspergillus ambiguus]|uniref:transcription factor domain-containing protein n=1 Tax=Aspergillus ambiguus TaxID=176160 RepID=UPI003CCDED6E